MKLNFWIFMFALGLSACNLPTGSPQPAPVEQTATFTPTTEELSAANRATATLTPTATLLNARLTITANTNCRSGPGQDYEILTVLTAGFESPIFGRAKDRNYWVVSNPNGGTCWAYGEFATLSGAADQVAEATPPPTATPSLPLPPRALIYTYICTFTDVTTSLQWKDASNNETGFRLYRNGSPIAELPAGTTAYTDFTAASAGSSFSYSLESFNATGASPQLSIAFTCQ